MKPTSLLDKKPLLLRKFLWFQIIVAMVLGIGIGLILSPTGLGVLDEEIAYTVASWVALPGQLFLSLIQMVVIPLVMTSIILGVASGGDSNFLKKVGLRIAPYFVLTTGVAVTIGIFIALFIQPGQYISGEFTQHMTAMGSADLDIPGAMEKMSLPDRLAKLIPTNPIESQVNKDMLAIVIYALFLGVATVSVKDKLSKPIIDLLFSAQAIAMQIVNWAMLMAPLAVFGLLCDITIRVGIDALIGTSAYVLTVIVGLGILLCFYLLLVAIIGRKSPGKFLHDIRSAQLLAFSTSSSAAVMPLSMKTAHEKLGVRKSISQFLIPLGATVNMDGTALYQVVAAVFITQVFGIDLSVSELVLLAITTVGASIGAPSTPGVGIVILATILVGIGVPASGIALILGVDRILDMTRTSVNVTGDLAACVVMEKWIGDKLEEPEETSKLPEVM